MIWKVIHRILAVKDAHLRRHVAVDPSCPFCGEGLETVEHLFFQCHFAMNCFSVLRSLCRAIARKGIRAAKEEDVLRVVGNAAPPVGKQHSFWF